MSNEAKTPNGASREIQIVETEEDICSDMVLLATAFDINDEKNKLEIGRKESRIADSNMLKAILENFQEIRLKGKGTTPKAKSTKAKSKKVSSKEKKEDEEKVVEDEEKAKKVIKTTTATENKVKKKVPTATENKTKVAKKVPTDKRIDDRE